MVLIRMAEQKYVALLMLLVLLPQLDLNLIQNKPKGKRKMENFEVLDLM